jgi:hypothetical protein
MTRYLSRCRRAISALPMLEHAFSSWLAGALLPTALSSDADHGGLAQGMPRAKTLLLLLPTLTATSYGSSQNGSPHDGREAFAGKGKPSLRRLLPTLTASRATYGQKNGVTYATAQGMAGGPLNPAWLEWYMGFPEGWTESGHSATRSSRNARKSLGK